MVSPKQDPLIHSIKLSTVGPGKATAQDTVHEPTNMDLAMKLHYLRVVYYFKSQAVEGLTIPIIKEPMFTWFNRFNATCGRYQRAETTGGGDGGRPYIKCNDCGVRFIEAHCVKTLDEWVEMVKEDDGSLHKLLVSNQVIGPELAFSPLVLLQITRFKCGGMSVGLSWAHVLGDAFSAAEFMNAWGQVMAGHQQPLKPAQSHMKLKRSESPHPPSKDPISVKRAGPIGDHWITTNNCKMGSFSFHLTTTQMSRLLSKVCGPMGSDKFPIFESLCAVIWKTVAKIRDGPGPKVVTICKNDPRGLKNGTLVNSQVISVVEAGFPIMEAKPKELAELITNQATDERSRIDEAVEADGGLSDFILYGANLTFVDLEEADIYGLELKAQKPAYVSYMVDGVGDEGAVLLLPGPEDDGGKVLTLIMPEDQVLDLKSELKREFSIA